MDIININLLNSQYQKIANCEAIDKDDLIKSFDQKLDLYFDITYENNEENKIGFDKDLYEDITLDIQAFNTSYFDFISIFNYLRNNKIQSFCELGCGYFRSGHLATIFYPDLKVVGVELSKHRQEYLRKKDLIVYEADLKTSSIPIAESYFVYLPEGVLIENIISLLPQDAIIFVVESHGGLISQFINDQRMDPVIKLDLLSKRHKSDIHLFKKNTNEIQSKESLLKHSLLYESYYLIDLNAMKFIASSEGADFYYHNEKLYIEFAKPNWLIKDIAHINLITRKLTKKEKDFLNLQYDGQAKRIYVDPKLLIDNGIERYELEKDCFDFFGGLKV